MDDGKPPSSKNTLDIGTRTVSALGSLVRRLADFGELCGGRWDIYCPRSSIHGRCLLVLKDI